MPKKLLTTKEAIECIERHAKKLEIMALAKEDTNLTVSEVYRKRAAVLRRRAKGMRELWGDGSPASRRIEYRTQRTMSV